jgi:hypothetical protein
MHLCFACGLGTFEDLLHEINAATRPVQLIAHQLISGACGCAKTTVNALAQNGFGFLSDEGV